MLLQDSSEREVVRVCEGGDVFDCERKGGERVGFGVQHLAAKSAEDASEVRRGEMLRDVL